MKSKKPTEDQKKERNNHIRLELNLIFQRFNYFLIGISFLLIALATIVSSDKFYPNSANTYFILLAGIICIAGCSLSFFFAVVNHLSSIVIKELAKIINKPTHNDYMADIIKWANEPWDKIGELLWTWGIFSDIGAILKDPFGKQETRKAAPHTYVVPFGFTVLWFIIWVILCFSIFYTLLLQCLSYLETVVILLIVLLIPLAPIIFYLCIVKKIRQKPEQEKRIASPSIVS